MRNVVNKSAGRANGGIKIRGIRDGTLGPMGLNGGNNIV